MPPRHGRKHSGIGGILVLDPDSPHHRVDEIVNRQAALLTGDHHAGREVHIGREIPRLDVEGNAEAHAPTLEFLDSVRLPLPRSVRKHDTAAAGQDVLHAHRNVIDADCLPRGHLHEADASEVRPVRQQPDEIVDGRLPMFRCHLAFLNVIRARRLGPVRHDFQRRGQQQ
jgi:hypothetical protein